MNIERLLNKTFEQAKSKNYDTIYWGIDLHGTLIKSTFNHDSFQLYPYVIDALNLIKSYPYNKLILSTSSYSEEISKTIKYFDNIGIHFSYANENPEAKDTTYGCYRVKPYYNIIIDDKAGFEPNIDWQIITLLLNKIAPKKLLS